jgi:hypothetical protein
MNQRRRSAIIMAAAFAGHTIDQTFDAEKKMKDDSP